jgi:hypothetical protein
VIKAGKATIRLGIINNSFVFHLRGAFKTTKLVLSMSIVAPVSVGTVDFPFNVILA